MLDLNIILNANELRKILDEYAADLVSIAKSKYVPIGPTGNLRRTLRAEKAKGWLNPSVEITALGGSGFNYSTIQHNKVLRHFMAPPITNGFASLANGNYSKGYRKGIATGQYVKYATTFMERAVADSKYDISKRINDILNK